MANRVSESVSSITDGMAHCMVQAQPLGNQARPPNAPRGPAAMRNGSGAPAAGQTGGSPAPGQANGQGAGAQRYSTQGTQRARPY